MGLAQRPALGPVLWVGVRLPGAAARESQIQYGELIPEMDGNISVIEISETTKITKLLNFDQSRKCW